jgi:hypothetical protein
MKTLNLAVVGCIAVIVAAATILTKQDSLQSGTGPLQVVPIGEMSVARAAHQATTLQSGDVLISGGCTGTCDANLRSTEIYKPKERAFQSAAAMATQRDSHVAIRLNDGRVLVAGGWSDRRATDSAEIYEPKPDRFVASGTLVQARAAASAALLSDGRVLITGGQNSEFAPLASAELFDPASSGFSSVGSMNEPRVAHVAVTLANGQVLVIGGRQARRGEILRSAELFDPSTGRFQRTGDMSSPRHKHAAALLLDGRVLVLGGADERDQRGRNRSTEIYDPQSGKFTEGPSMHWPRFKIPDAVTVLPSGTVLVAGGANQLELYDPAGNTFVIVHGTLNAAREFATASLLPDGEVLILGGYDEQVQTSAFAWLVRAR